MTSTQIEQLLSGLGRMYALIETHISWVLMGPERVYKVRKPIRYAFLDFSTPELRKADCEKELWLNRRTSPQIYLQVVPVREHGGEITFGEGPGQVIDHAVEMVRLDSDRQMDVLLRKGMVERHDITALAVHLADFHSRAILVDSCPTAHGLWLDLADVLKVEPLTHDVLGPEAAASLRWMVSRSKTVLDRLEPRIRERHDMGFSRDVHGDLHTRNIFLLPEPVLFDCLEFNDHLRQIDLLNELAFLGMDLEAFGRSDLWHHFLSAYQSEFPVILTPNDKVLLKFYMGYRANVRYKIAALRGIQDQKMLNVKELTARFEHMRQYFEDITEFKYDNIIY
ncbi:MAG: hypothetical protein IPJ06_16880 [Saprospiraceae bacterium]|nr:hypothetical protein [Saprospiraceae bacterium]